MDFESEVQALFAPAVRDDTRMAAAVLHGGPQIAVSEGTTWK